MSKYRRPLIAIATVVAVSTFLSACVVVPVPGYYRHKHRHYYGEATPAFAPAVAPAARA